MLLGVDVGGTFTDAVVVDRNGGLFRGKVASTPENQAVGVLEAVRMALGRAGARAGWVERFAHGTTVATNGLLQGRTARTGLVATAGFTDVIELGRQGRASLYRLCERAPEALVGAELRFGARERCTAEGVLVELAEEEARRLVERVAGSGVEAVAVALLHSYAFPEHERRLGELLQERLPGAAISLSSELVGTFREYERTATTVLDAAVSPLVSSYLRSLAESAAAEGLREPEVMQSSGGLASVEQAARHGAVTLLSGPAGGVGGARLLAERAGVRDVLCLDMGGTSCDVCLILGGEVGERAGRTVAGRPLALASLDIETVGAGGGSIAWLDPGGALRVGPDSAGAQPGPACYGRGGREATVTDANLLLGRLGREAELAGGLRLDREAATAAVGRLAGELGLGVEECAAGIVRVAEAEMLRALRVMSVERGIDPRGLTLMAFGGAGPLHGCGLADELGIEKVLCPGAAGVLCALGLAAGEPRRDASRTVMLSGASFTAESVSRARAELLERVSAEVGTVGRWRATHEMRFAGQSFELSVASESVQPAELRRLFEEAHEGRYGYRQEGGEVELVTMRVSAWGPAAATLVEAAGTGKQAGERIEGPAVRSLGEATVYVAEGWRGEVDGWGTIHLERRAPPSPPSCASRIPAADSAEAERARGGAHR
ncbi:MAG TPA: hydantoinase/oxoprolinase family protein [Solirubrobacteraceae bacterium]|nr:hydantoinase/oxoprolinase family protein [Solirubrobacteraceae bacterium]